jgi:hypothetical protein
LEQATPRSNAANTAVTKSADFIFSLHSSGNLVSPREQINKKDNQSNNQEEMDQASCDVQSESKKPRNHEDRDNSPSQTHIITSAIKTTVCDTIKESNPMG